MTKRTLLAAAALFLAMTAPGFAQDATTDATKIKAGDYVLEAPHGKITWSIDHLGFSTYVGQFTGVEATLKVDPAAPEKTQLKATIDTASLGTLNPKLDEHLKSADFFNVAKFPSATFEATQVEATGDKTARVTGTLTLMGVAKSETMDVTFNQAGINPVDHKYEIGFTGASTIKRSDFGITKYLPSLGDDVTLQMEGEFVEAGQ